MTYTLLAWMTLGVFCGNLVAKLFLGKGWFEGICVGFIAAVLFAGFSTVFFKWRGVL